MLISPTQVVISLPRVSVQMDTSMPTEHLSQVAAAPKGCRVYKVLPELKAQPVPKVSRALSACKVMLVRKVLPAQVHKACKAPQVPKELLVQAPKVQLVHKAQSVHKVQPEHKAQPVQEHKASKARPEHKASKAQSDHKACKEFRVSRGL